VLDLAQLTRTFTLRTSDGFVENFGPQLIARIHQKAPGVRLNFVQKLNKDSTLLREGSVDLETGVIGESTSPEVRTRMLFRDRLIGVVRKGHPLTQGEVTPVRYADARHVLVSRRGHDKGVMDDALNELGLKRDIITIVAGFSAAIALARASDLVASVPQRHVGNLCQGMHCFALPFPTPPITVSMLWHPRMDTDPAHRWLRGCVWEVCSQ
jgi:DNA-binding transcriptional LysR family regulator